MATGTPGYPNMGTDLHGNPIPLVYQGGSVATPPPRPAPMPSGAVAVLTKGKTGTTIPAAQSPIDVQALRTMLVKAGYNIPKQGAAAGNLFKAALRDFIQPSAGHPVADRLLALIGANRPGQPLAGGLRNPKAFNQAHGLLAGGKVNPPTRPTSTGANHQFDPSGNFIPEATPPDPTSQQPTIDLSALSGLSRIAGSIGTPIPLIPTSYADQLAGLAHDSKIHDLGINAQRQGRDSAQSLEDISHWYDQAAGARKTAASRDAAISDAGTQSVRDAVSSIVSSLGGSANQGSGLVAASGADQAGLLSALGTNESQYNADLAPLLANESAGAHTRQQALNTKGAQDIAQQIVDEQGLRGQDKASALMQILNENASRRGQNNALEQTRFGDALSLQQAQEAAALTGAKVITAESKAAVPPKPTKGSFGASATVDRTNYTKDVLSQIAPNGVLPKGMTRSKATAIASRLASIYFPKGGIPNGTGLIASILNQVGL